METKNIEGIVEDIELLEKDLSLIRAKQDKKDWEYLFYDGLDPHLYRKKRISINEEKSEAYNNCRQEINVYGNPSSQRIIVTTNDLIEKIKKKNEERLRACSNLLN